jgi:septum formation protein
MPELILASTSSYRRALLERLGLPFRGVAPNVDERALERPEWSPAEIAERLAKAKALAVLELFPDAIVIGGDQVAIGPSGILHKPETFANAETQLAELAGKSHELVTAICVASRDRVESHVDRTRLRMRSLTAEQIHRYVSADLPLDCAGSYKLESRGITLFESIESDDHTAITGMPLLALTTILRDFGFALP